MLDRSKIVFVADMFAEEFTGGAELTSQALIDLAPCEVVKVKAIEVNPQLIHKHRNHLWIFGNFSELKYTLLPDIVHNLQYAVIEYDYKFCQHRSIEIHKAKDGVECDCDKFFGKKIAQFMKSARALFWMSEAQAKIYKDRFITLREANDFVLSSVFCQSDLMEMRNIRDTASGRSGWVVLTGGSWIKGVENSMAYCKRHNLEAVQIRKMAHADLLRQFGKVEGLVFMPRGGDSCPRIVIEAKLCGAQLAINDHVQHKDEGWFSSGPGAIEDYLSTRPAFFWSKIGDIYAKNEDRLAHAAA